MTLALLWVMCGARPVILRFSLSGSLSPNPFPSARFWSGIKKLHWKCFDPKLKIKLVWEVWKTEGLGAVVIVIFESKFKLQPNKLHHQMTYHLIFYILNWHLNRQLYDLNLQNDQALLFVCIFVVDKFLLVPYLFPPGFFLLSLTHHTGAFDPYSFQISKS